MRHRLKKPLLLFLAREAVVTRALSSCASSLRDYWIATLRSDTDLEELLAFLATPLPPRPSALSAAVPAPAGNANIKAPAGNDSVKALLLRNAAPARAGDGGGGREGAGWGPASRMVASSWEDMEVDAAVSRGSGNGHGESGRAGTGDASAGPRVVPQVKGSAGPATTAPAQPPNKKEMKEATARLFTGLKKQLGVGLPPKAQDHSAKGEAASGGEKGEKGEQGKAAATAEVKQEVKVEVKAFSARTAAGAWEDMEIDAIVSRGSGTVEEPRGKKPARAGNGKGGRSAFGGSGSAGKVAGPWDPNAVLAAVHAASNGVGSGGGKVAGAIGKESSGEWDPDAEDLSVGADGPGETDGRDAGAADASASEKDEDEDAADQEGATSPGRRKIERVTSGRGGEGGKRKRGGGSGGARKGQDAQCVSA